MNVNLKHWTGTVLVAVLAGLVIFGLVRGQEMLSKFLKSEPREMDLEKGQILEQIQPSPTPAIKPLPKNILINTFSPTPLPIQTQTPLPTSIMTLTPTPILTLTPSPQLQTYTSTPSPTLAPTSEPSPEQQPAKININTADKTELEKITGVGPVIAQRIIDYRNANGPFQRIEDIKNVKGIGDVTFEKMKDEITIWWPLFE